MLREAAGWMSDQRVRYFAWFNKAREFKGGNSLGKFVERIKEQALAHVPDADRAALAGVLAGLLSVLTKDEVLDLLAYIESGGNEKAPAFRK